VCVGAATSLDRVSEQTTLSVLRRVFTDAGRALLLHVANSVHLSTCHHTGAALLLSVHPSVTSLSHLLVMCSRRSRSTSVFHRLSYYRHLHDCFIRQSTTSEVTVGLCNDPRPVTHNPRPITRYLARYREHVLPMYVFTANTLA